MTVDELQNVFPDAFEDVEIAKPKTDIHNVLDERGKRYGDFKDHARLTQYLKRVMQNSKSWDDCTDSQREALEMIQHKIGRILNGDPSYDDSWRDIIGYAQLVLDQLEKE